MRRFRIVLALGVFFLLGTMVVITQTGCEEAKGVGELRVDPDAVTLTNANETVIFSVVSGITNSILALPLTWEVGNASLGQIIASSGMTAVYRRSAANGANAITVRDQFEKEGYATITQK